MPLRTLPDLDAAMQLHAQLVEAGVPATLVADQRLGESGPLFVARRAAWAGLDLVVSAADEQRLRLDLADVRIAVRASVLDMEGSDDPNKLRARAISGKVLTQIWGGAQRVHVLDLHPASGRPARIVAERFDYSILGAERGPLAVDNFERLVEIVLEQAPGASIVTTFSKVVADDPRMPHLRQLELFGRRLLQALLQSE